MRRTIAFTRICIVMLLAASCSTDHSAAPAPTGPARIHFDETTIDLGDVPTRREPYVVRFPFVNRGLAALEINRLEKGCTCLDADASKSEIAPGEGGLITLHVAADRPASRSADVVVHSNAGGQPRVRLTAQWRAVAPIEFEPLRLDFGIVRPNSSMEREVTMRRTNSAGRSECRVLQLDARGPGLLLTPERNDHAELRLIHVRLTAGPQSGEYSSAVTADLGGCWPEQLRLPVTWTVRDVIESSPAELMLGAGTPHESVHGMVYIVSHPGERLEIESVHWNDPLADPPQVHLQRLTDHRVAAHLDWELPAEPGSHQRDLVCVCNRPEPRTLVVPVFAYVRSDPEDSP